MASLSAGQPALELQAARLIESMLRLSRLAERLLALARAEGAEPLVHEWVDLDRVVSLTVEEFRRDPRLRGRELTADVTAVRVRGDLDAAGLVLRNLVENALVHGSGGHWIRVSCRREQDGIVMAVTDDGPGVPPDDLPTLTQRFKRAGNTAAVGAGLGLAIVAMLARRMRARLGLKSPPQGLATGFEVRLTWPASGESRT
jgi:two-component system OmpR family sensor kinase